MYLHVEVTWDNGIEGSDFEDLYIKDMNQTAIIEAIKGCYGEVILLDYNHSFIEVKSKFKGVFRAYLPSEA